jgi:hypothetical protein
MRDQKVWVSSPSGELEVVVTGEALASLRTESVALHDGASLMHYYRSLIAEIALEKAAEAEEFGSKITLSPSDFVG